MLLTLGQGPLHAADRPADPAAAETHAWTLEMANWPQPPNAPRLLALPAVRSAVRAWLLQAERGDDRAKLVIAHATTDTGTAWAGELRAWLSALAVPTAAIETRPDDTPPARLRLFIETR